jgi:hypothetical protein
MSKNEELAESGDGWAGRHNEGGGIKSLTTFKGEIKWRIENKKSIDRLSAMNIIELVLNDKK